MYSRLLISFKLKFSTGSTSFLAVKCSEFSLATLSKSLVLTDTSKPFFWRI